MYASVQSSKQFYLCNHLRVLFFFPCYASPVHIVAAFNLDASHRRPPPCLWRSPHQQPQAPATSCLQPRRFRHRFPPSSLLLNTTTIDKLPFTGSALFPSATNGFASKSEVVYSGKLQKAFEQVGSGTSIGCLNMKLKVYRSRGSTMFF
ncbi:unnamed protein product [Lactuca saligna]|uniref:Uncharacterized protein n=1 Tax=Lactuca saligna TaxID=75948 RepID=A0AA35ZQG7_LACSI|nr:unnamed protein product [Lactuca saligna]